jgi:hypothetical protein
MLRIPGEDYTRFFLSAGLLGFSVYVCAAHIVGQLFFW